MKTIAAAVLALAIALSAFEACAQPAPPRPAPSPRGPDQIAEKSSSLLVRAEGVSMRLPDLEKAGIGKYQLRLLFGPEASLQTEDRQPVTWLVAVPKEGKERSIADSWDAAHELLDELRKSPAFKDAKSIYVEANVRHVPYRAMDKVPECDKSKKRAPPDIQICRDQDKVNWDVGRSFAWHLEKDYSQLREARKEKPTSCTPHITILDTGIRASHATTPRNIDKRGYNFVEDNGNVEDPGPYFGDKNSGHGPATIAILAGKRVRTDPSDPRYSFDDDLGGAPDATIVPVRIADSVVHFYTEEMARGIEHAGKLAKSDGAKACHVVSISMGGLASRAWADAVNFAYNQGVTIVAAAGNNLGGFPTRYTVYPSRFARVITAAGATAKHAPYQHRDRDEMAGNWGPPSVMTKALAAYTPNTPWVDYRHDDVVNHDGAGTSSATPQIAAAAALWLGKYGGKYPADWQRVVAVRKALFQAAERNTPSRKISEEFYGNGLLRAAQAMSKDPGVKPEDKIPPAEVSFPFWRILLGLDEPKAYAGKPEDGEIRMLEVESVNIALRTKPFEHLVGDESGKPPSAGSDDGQRLLAQLCSDPRASKRLRKFVQTRKGCPNPPK